jgi:MoaA/NifB/PqqE/SkfB family radical SAM enzyme
MSVEDWERVIDQAAAHGVRLVQFIGGEPTLYGPLPRLIRYALAAGVEVEVYSNLVHVPDALWEAFSLPGVRLATSWYSDDPDEHQRITGRPTWQRTRDNIVLVLSRGIPLRVGIVRLTADQRVAEAKALLAQLGVEDVWVDRMRHLGRPAPGQAQLGELCGQCGDRSAAVLPDGRVTPCPMARWMAVGNVRESALADALARVGEQAALVKASVRAELCGPDNDGQCNPCEPTCNPGCDPGVDDD